MSSGGDPWRVSGLRSPGGVVGTQLFADHGALDEVGFELLAHGFSAAHAHAHETHPAGRDPLYHGHPDLRRLTFRDDLAFAHRHQDFSAHSSPLARQSRIDESDAWNTPT